MLGVIESGNGDSGARNQEGRLPAQLAASVRHARRQFFPADVGVFGVIVRADIGPVSWGEVYGHDKFADGSFIKFQAVGLDNRMGYDLVKTAAGGSYVIVAYAEHAKERGTSGLAEHIRVNRDWYRVRAGEADAMLVLRREAALAQPEKLTL